MPIFLDSRTIEENSKKELKLRMTCGRVVVFCNHWIKCRKETIDIFNKILAIFKSKAHRAQICCLLACICLRDETSPVQTYLEWLVSKDGFQNFPIQFAHVVNKDFSCHKILLRKLTELMDLVKSSEYLKAFDVEARDLFFNVSTCQTDLSTRQSDSCPIFETCENIIRQQQEGHGTTAKLLACTSRPLVHLKDLLRNLHDDDILNEAGIEMVIAGLQNESNDFSTIFFESLKSFQNLSESVNDAAKQMKKGITEWLPRREQSIAKIKEIIEKLNKTTKDIAITQTVSSSVGIVRGFVTAACLVAAPFTFGTSLIVGGVVSGVGAKIAEIVIDKGDIENAMTCIDEDKVSFEEVIECIKNLNSKSSMLLGYIPLDELASLMSVMTDRQTTPMVRNFSKPKAETLVDNSQVVVAGVVFASKAGVLSVLPPLFVLGAIFDIVSLVQAAWTLGQGARSKYSEKLEGVVRKMVSEKGIIQNCLASLESSI